MIIVLKQMDMTRLHDGGVTEQVTALHVAGFQPTDRTQNISSNVQQQSGHIFLQTSLQNYHG